MFAAQAGFVFVFGGADDGVAGGFGAGAGGGGNGDPGGWGLGDFAAFADDFEIIEHGSVVSEKAGDGFAAVDGAAAADGDDHVALVLFCDLEGGSDIADCGFAALTMEGVAEVGGFQKFQGAVGGFAVEYDQGGLAEGFGEIGELGDFAPAEDDFLRGGEFEMEWIHISDDTETE